MLAKSLGSCAVCGSSLPTHVRDCVVCGAAAGFPNVRAAEAQEERQALQQRVDNAFVSAHAGNYSAQLTDFGDAVTQRSTAVIARPLLPLQRLIDNSNLMLMTFYAEMDAGGRTAENNHWDRGREQIDSLVNPLYHRDLHFAALSLDGMGVKHYGDFHINLVSDYIAIRSSVFNENPFKFGQRHRIVVGTGCPPGYRATWMDRGKLAQAKLFPKLSNTSKPNEYPDVLVSDGSGSGDEDFIEVHVFGSISSGTIKRIVAYEPKGAEKHIWRALRRKIEAAGIEVEIR
ncbi:hypothetical protein [Mesorhizobium muleiense]|uniref:Uncharacterized protein n=1 Tax=Mesorhizobium muleiense TaxID=1004279 RepID=A0A1G8MRZ0_9HYPH|nr:hypothetical protein [Mesorhizobium muleiense]MCF6103121.1 hypothetical protein [Mesorhizobium muleiense]SDI70617.1 hypothetical protein SAMN05428953_102651 [Mesorhizobium muleiense]